MRRELLFSAVNALENRSSYFQQRDDSVIRKGLSLIQKCTAAIRQLTYGVSADHLDEYLTKGESITIKCLFKFCGYVVELFGDRYLTRANDVECLLQMCDVRHDFPGMWGRLDCMHSEWENCLFSWKCQFTRGHGSPTIVLEAVVSRFVDMACILWCRRFT
ncbi:uncharacterized protein LOC142547840 [Primulina tabacum]|uniref:uncharacterized protein LOC142547840 n=1 Tax=Primulina tabacum TaxID=48773 RepID=UPI003F5ACDAE